MTIHSDIRAAWQMQPVQGSDIRASLHDAGCIAFGAMAVAALAVSVPATYTIMQRYHTHTWTGTTQAVASLIVFEVGALISKIATLLFPQWSKRLQALQIVLLVVVFAANCNATLALAAPTEQVQAIAFAAFLPVFQWIFLALAVGRAKALHVARLEAAWQRPQTPAERIEAMMQAWQERQVQAALHAFEEHVQRLMQPSMQPSELHEVKVLLHEMTTKLDQPVLAAQVATYPTPVAVRATDVATQATEGATQATEGATHIDDVVNEEQPFRLDGWDRDGLMQQNASDELPTWLRTPTYAAREPTQSVDVATSKSTYACPTCGVARSPQAYALAKRYDPEQARCTACRKQ